MKKSVISRVYRFFHSDSEGGALVEMAVTLPLLMLIMTGIFSFSFTLYQKLQLAESVSNAGRYLATARGDTDPCATTISQIKSAAPGLSSTNMTITLTDNGTALATTCPATGGSALTKGDNVIVKVVYPTSLSVYGFGYTSFNLTSQITEIVQ